MELLVVLGIFSMVVTAASDIFILTSRSQRKVFGLERTQADARFTLEAIAREVRTGTIDYAWYASNGGLAAPVNDLVLIDSTNRPLRFSLSDASNATACAVGSAPCLLVSTDDGATWSAITPQGVVVREARFYIAPAADPDLFDPGSGTYAADMQPRVTVVLTLDSVIGRAEERSTLNLQTTVASRKYKR